MLSGPSANVLAIPNFRFYVTGRFLTGMASHIQTVAVGLYVYYLTRDPLALGLAGFFTFLPQLLLVAAGGHVADTYDRRLVSAASYFVSALSSVGLAGLVVAGAQSVWWFYAAISLVGVTRVFGMPANQAMVANLVPAVERSRAAAMSSSAVQTATIIGPALGGLIYVYGAAVAFAVAALLHLAAVTFFLRITPQAPQGRGDPFSLDAFRVGAGFIIANKALLGALSLDLVGVLFAGVVALLPIYATEILEAGPQALGWLRTSQAVGALGMALVLARFPIRRHAGRWMFAAAFVYGSAIIGFGLSRMLILSMALMMVEGAADMVSVVVRSTLIQNETPDALRGRVSSVNTLFIGASNSLGEFESGLAARLMGVVPATIFGGVMSLATTALWMRLFPALRRRDAL